MFNFIKNLLKKPANKVELAARKVPSDSMVLDFVETKMNALFYLNFADICEQDADNTKSFTFKNGRPYFTARGAYLFRKDINESQLLDMKKFTNGKPIVTHLLTDSLREMDLAEFLKVAEKNFKAETGNSFRDYHDVTKDCPTIDQYWSFYCNVVHLSLVYLYCDGDLNFCVERLFRSLFKMIAIETLSQPCLKKDELVAEAEDELVVNLSYFMHPLSLNAFSLLRNSAPRLISQRMPTVQIKLKKLNQSDYESPFQKFKMKNEL